MFQGTGIVYIYMDTTRDPCASVSFQGKLLDTSWVSAPTETREHFMGLILSGDDEEASRRYADLGVLVI